MVPLIVSLSIIGVILLIVLICSIKIVRQAEKIIVERLGGYRKTWDVGIHMLVPFIDKVAHRVSMKEQIRDFAPQAVITKVKKNGLSLVCLDQVRNLRKCKPFSLRIF